MKTYWYYTAVIFAEDGEVEYSNVIETTSQFFPISEVLKSAYESANITPDMFSVRFATRVDYENYAKIYDMIQEV